MSRSFERTRTWIFDLDNTLYPASARIFDQINRLMTAFIQDKVGVSGQDADHLRRDLWMRHGTTMAGLAAEHGIEPEDFLEACHVLDLSVLSPDPDLSAALQSLPGRRIVHTNGPRANAERIVAARGLATCFEQIIAIEDTGLVSKPTAEAYARARDLSGHTHEHAVMIEDHADNLRVPRALGMTTVWLDPDMGSEQPDHVDHRISALTPFLQDLARRR